MPELNRIQSALKETLKAVPKYLTMKLVGSTYIRNATESDIDILVLVPKFEVLPAPWEEGGSGGSGAGGFQSWKMGEINIIQVESLAYYRSWVRSTEVCRFLHLRGFTVPTAVVHGIHGIVMDGSCAVLEDAHRPE